MRWSERQRAMLRDIGIPPFWPVEDTPAATQAPQQAPARPLPPHAAQEAAPAPQAAVAPVASAAPAMREPSQPTLPRAALGVPPARAGAGSAAPQPVLGPRPAGVDTMDWPALREAVASCQACGLCQSRTQPVFGVGHPQAEWMIVGEAPGEQEDKLGEPFVGRAGALLDRMLQALGLTREEAPPSQQIFVANVLKCRPPANRNPLPQEVAQCEPFLLRQVALVQPKVILAMGRFAVQALLKSTEPIGKLRGQIHQVAGVPVVVTYHPAYLLRTPADKGLAWDDLCRARALCQAHDAPRLSAANPTPPSGV